MRKAHCKEQRVTRSSYRLSAFTLINRLVQTVDPSAAVVGSYVNRITGACRSRDVLRLLEIAEEIAQPQKYCCAKDYALGAQIAAFIKKVPFSVGVTHSDREASAIRSFDRAEKLCRITNKRVSHYASNLHRIKDVELRSVLIRARRIIDEILGDIDRGVKNTLEKGRHGPGSSADTVDSKRTSAFYKYSLTELSVSRMARDYAHHVIRSNPRWWHVASTWEWTDGVLRQSLAFQLRESNRVAFVFKNAKTYRGIAIENTMDVYLQLGAHEHIAARLKQVCGISIFSQLRNQRLAYLGSSSRRSLATIDLSMASDTVSRSTVECLLPGVWAGFLDDLRATEYHHPTTGHLQKYDKWSSMGNGYTFALETLIFTALIRASAEVRKYPLKRSNHSVYGDDIIVPNSIFDLVIRSLKFFGFKPNSDKTFSSGPFRESCGADFFDTTPVRPVFIREEKLDLIQLFTLANGLGKRGFDHFFEVVVNSIPEHFRVFVPNNASDSDGIKAPIWYLHNEGHLKWVPCEQRQKYRRLVYRTKSEYTEHPALLLVRLGGTSVPSKWDPYDLIRAVGQGNKVGLRGSTSISTRWSALICGADRQCWPAWFY